MACSISSIPDIADCLYRLKDIVDLAHAAMGIVSTSLLTGLLWCLKRWKKDTDRLDLVVTDKNKEIEALQQKLAEFSNTSYIAGLYGAISDTIENWHHKCLFRSPNIPKYKDDAARQQSPIPGSETPLALFDFTRMGTMSHFLVIGYDGLYWHGNNHIEWVQFLEGDITANDTAVILGAGAPIEVGGGVSADALSSMLASLHKALTPFFEFEDNSSSADSQVAAE